MKMKSFAITTSAAILGLAGGLANAEAAAHSPNVPGKEKCYGIAKAGKNDCGWSGGSCVGSAKTDGNKEAWIFVPTDTCNKILNGSLQASKGSSAQAPVNQIDNVTIINNPVVVTKPVKQPSIPKPTTPTVPVVTPAPSIPETEVLPEPKTQVRH